MKNCPQCRASFDETVYNFCPIDGTKLGSVESSTVPVAVETLPANPRKFKLTSLSSPLITDNEAQIEEPVMTFNISMFYQSARNAAELYEITRGFWKIFSSRANRAKYGFAVYRGEIKEVYKIEGWEPAKVEDSAFWIKYKREQGEEIDLSINKGRFQFIGQPASDEIRDKYVGKKMPESVSKYPVNYFN